MAGVGCSLVLWGAVAWGGDWSILGPEGAPTGQQIAVEAVFGPASGWRPARVETDPAALGAVAEEALRYLRTRAEADPLAVQPGMLAELGVTLRDVEETLALIAETARTAPERLSDPAWLAAHFDAYTWTPDRASAAARGLSLPASQLRLTRYLVYQQPGRLSPEGEFRHALYAPPRDEAGLSVEAAEARRDGLLRYRYTRAEVMGGIYGPGGAAEGLAEPLVWLTRQGVYEAIMQGTVEVILPDGSRRLFNVDRANGMPYDPAIRDPGQQRRYWYFAEVEGVMGWGPERAHKVALQTMVAVAVDVYNLGLGKLVALERGGTVRLAILADTGGAFQPNLFQLDLFTGSYPSKAAFEAATKALGGTAAATILVRRRPVPPPPPDGVQPTP